MTYTYRNLVKNDYDEIEEMFYCVFPEVEKGLEEAFQYRVKNLSKGICLDTGELAGFILCDVYGDQYELIKINYIVIHPAYQNLGLGSKLLQHVLHLCMKMKKKVTLVPVMKLHIIRWYRKQGFRITKVRDAAGGGKLYEMTYNA